MAGRLERIRAASEEFACLYLGRDGIYGVGVERANGKPYIRVSGDAKALAALPNRFRGVKVARRVGTIGFRCGS